MGVWECGGIGVIINVIARNAANSEMTRQSCNSLLGTWNLERGTPRLRAAGRGTKGEGAMFGPLFLVKLRLRL